MLVNFIQTEHFSELVLQNLIQARAPDSVVIIVGTFYDKLSAKDKKSGFVDRMHNLIRELYVGKELGGGVGIPRERGLPNVVRTIDVSCTTGHQISQLREIIYNTALEIKGHGRKYENASEVVGSG